MLHPYAYCYQMNIHINILMSIVSLIIDETMTDGEYYYNM